MRHPQTDADPVIREIIETIRRHDRKNEKKTKGKAEGRKTSPPPEYGLGRAVGLATALAFAGVLAFATGVTGLATALALAGVLAFTVVLVRIGVSSELALGEGSALCGAAGRGGVEACGGAGHQTGEGDGGEHGFRILEEAWIFHVSWVFRGSVGC